MPKYINADKILSHLNDEIEACGDPDVYFQPVVYGTYLGLKYSKSLVETAETADVEEVKRGKMNMYKPRRMNRNATYKCSVCGKLCSSYYNDVGEWKFCPHCGAKMDWEDE